MKFSVAAIFAVAGVSAAMASEAGKNPMVGTWTYNPQKSVYRTGMPIRSETVTFSPKGDVLVESNTIVDGGGNLRHGGNAARDDGKENPMTAEGQTVPGATLSMKPITGKTVERRILSNGGKNILDIVCTFSSPTEKP